MAPVVAAYALMLTAWIFGNPPYGAPDEWHHYIRAVSIGYGQLVGEPAGLDGARAIVGHQRPADLSEQVYRDQLAWVAQNTTRVHVPAGKTPGWFRCGALQQDALVPARCLNNSPPVPDAQTRYTPAGNYQPFPYLVPALLSRAVQHPDTLTRAMRSGKAAVALGLLTTAILLLWDAQARLLSLAGLVVSTTPMVVFLSATLNPSGLEIAASIAFVAALLRLTREESERRWAWLGLAASGVVLALSRGQGPFWIALNSAILACLPGIGRFSRIALRDRYWAAPSLLVIAGAILANRVWEHLHGPVLAFDPFPLTASIRAGFSELPPALRQQIGVFDYLEVDMPRFAYALWTLAACALVGAGLTIGSPRQRVLLLVAIATALLVPVALVAATMRHTGFALQGRYVLALSVVVPLLAGEIVVRGRERLFPLGERLLILFLFGTVAFVQFVGWWANARRFAVGRAGPRWFLAAAEWSPPFGWWPWMLIAGAGACLIFAAALLDWWLNARSPWQSRRLPSGRRERHGIDHARPTATNGRALM